MHAITYLVIDLQVDGLAWLDADHKLVGGHVYVGADLVLENVAWHMPEELRGGAAHTGKAFASKTQYADKTVRFKGRGGSTS